MFPFHPKVFIYGKSARVIISRVPGFEALLTTLAHALSLCLPLYFPPSWHLAVSRFMPYIRTYEVNSKLALFAHYINALISLSVWRYANFMQYHFLSAILTPMTPISTLYDSSFSFSLSYSLVNYRSSDIDYLSKISRFVKEFINRKLDFRFFFLKKSREDSIFKKSTRIPERIFVSFPRRIKITLRATGSQMPFLFHFSLPKFESLRER